MKVLYLSNLVDQIQNTICMQICKYDCRVRVRRLGSNPVAVFVHLVRFNIAT